MYVWVELRLDQPRLGYISKRPGGQVALRFCFVRKKVQKNAQKKVPEQFVKKRNFPL